MFPRFHDLRYTTPVMDYFNVGKLAVWHHETARPKGRIILTHGICEHSGRHLNTVNAFTAAGYEVVRFDLRGAGRSGGPPQYVDRFSDYTDDLLSIFNWTQAKLNPLPLFLMGHSMGGLITLHATPPIQKLLQGVILSAPAFITGSAVPPIKIAIGRLINRLYPQFRIPSTSDQGCLSRIPEVIANYNNDPQSFHFNTVRQGDQVLKAMADIPNVCPKITTPTLLVHGSHDRLILLEGSYRIFRMLGSRNRVLAILPGGYHELHNDLDRAELFQTLQFWLDGQLEAKNEPRASENSLAGDQGIGRRSPQAQS
ncbi:MAG: lysophospholipase [Deltaproteobacteria bacterium]|nr:lysophospholipase [Deltaproteobacteria bacterium]